MKKELVFLIIIVFIPIFGIFIGFFLNVTDLEDEKAGVYQTSTTSSGRTSASGGGTAGSYGTGTTGNYGTTSGGRSTSYYPGGNGDAIGTTSGGYSNGSGSGSIGEYGGTSGYEVTEADLENLYYTIFYNASQMGRAAGENLPDSNIYKAILDAMKGIIRVNAAGSYDATMTFAKELFQGVAPETLHAVKQNPDWIDCQSVYENADGSIVFVIDRDSFREVEQEMAVFCSQFLSEIASEGDAVFNISSNGDYTQFQITTYSTELGDEEEIFVYLIYIDSAIYQIMTGSDAEFITVDFINYPSGVSLGTLDSRNL